MNEFPPSLLLLAAVAAPLLTTLLLAIPSWRTALLRATPVAALPALVLVLWGPIGTTLDLPWMAPHSVLKLDEVARVFLGFTSTLYLAAGWYARGYLVKDANCVRFHLFFLLTMTGNFGLILAADIPTFYTAFALMGLASAGLVFHQGNAESLRAGRIYLALAMVGEVLILSGFVFLSVAGGTTQIAELHRGVFSQPALLLLLVGFGIKAGALSLHFWLPLAHPAAPVPASAVLSGALIKAGLLGWIRFLPLGEATLPGLGFTLISAGLGSAFLGTVVGVAQKNPKAVLAYSSISQMGIIMTGLGIGAMRPEAWLGIQSAVLIYATHHALAKGSLFLGVGPAHAAHTRRQRLGVGLGLVLPALALAGAPLTSGALAKTALKANIAFLPEGWALALGLLLPLAAAGTTLKMARFLWLTWPRPGHPIESSARGLWLPWFGLLVAMLIGVWLLPGALDVLPKKLSGEALWDAFWPLVAGGTLAALATSFRRWFSADPERWLPAGDIGVLIERLLTRGRLLRPLRFTSPKARKSEVPSTDDGPWWTRLEQSVGPRLAAVEQWLRSSPVAGTLLLLLVGVLVISLMAR